MIRAGITFHGVPSRLWVGRRMPFFPAARNRLCRASTEIRSGAHSQGQYSGAAKTVEPQSRGEGDDFYNLSPSLTQGTNDGGRSG